MKCSHGNTGLMGACIYHADVPVSLALLQVLVHKPAFPVLCNT